MSSMISPSSWPKRRVRSTSTDMTSWKRRWLNRPVSSSVTAWRWIASCRSTFSIEIAAWLVRYSNSSRWRCENGSPGRAIEITPSTPSSGSGALSGRARAFALELELLQPRLELARHQVELVAERGELVVALGRDLDREVALADVARGREQAADLGLQRARGGQRERERADQEREQDADDEDLVVGDGGVVELA